MSTPADGLRDDINFMRNLAEQGRRGPVLGGVFLAAAGIIYGSASLVQWALSRGLLHWSPQASASLWWGTSALFAVVWVILFLRIRATARDQAGAANYAFAIAWTGCALGITALFFPIYEVSRALHDPAVQFLWAPMAFAFYGTAWFVSAGASRTRWMFAIAAIAYLMAPALALFTGSADALLVMAAGLFLTLVVPGVRLAMKPQ